MTSASIDDLLRYEDEPPSRRGGRAGLTRTALLVAVLTAAVAGGLRMFGVTVSVALVAVGVLALVTLRRVLRQVAPPGRAHPGRRASGPVGGAAGVLDDAEGMYQFPPPDAMRRAVVRWEQRLSWCADSPASFGDGLRPVLRELADERLRLGYGVTIDGDPARARELLGEPLWSLLTGQHRRGPGQRGLARAVAALEELSGKVAR